MKKLIILLVVVAVPVLAYSVDAPSPKIVRDNSELFSYIIGICFLIISYFIHRMLGLMDKKNEASDRNNINQWKAITSVDIRLSHLEGTCNERHNPGGRRSYDPVNDLRKEGQNGN